MVWRLLSRLWCGGCYYHSMLTRGSSSLPLWSGGFSFPCSLEADLVIPCCVGLIISPAVVCRLLYPLWPGGCYYHPLLSEGSSSPPMQSGCYASPGGMNAVILTPSCLGSHHLPPVVWMLISPPPVVWRLLLSTPDAWWLIRLPLLSGC